MHDKFAIEEKYRSVRVYVRGDEWTAEQIDKYGKPRGARFPIRDGKGRSPSEQVKRRDHEFHAAKRTRS
jgi:hypothetical protein